MATRREYKEYILERLSELGRISCRAMMGEYILYYKGKIIGGLYDNRLLIKPVKSILKLMPDAPLEAPFEGGRPMLRIEDTDNTEQLARLIRLLDAPPPF